MTWSTDSIPTQRGRTFVITGANGGIGLEAASLLARQEARLVLACRNLEKAKIAVERLKSETPGVDVTVLALDLSDLASVRAFNTALRDIAPRIDVLINNAGVMAIPRRLTADGFEMQLGTNHLGHFALTGLLLDLLSTDGHARIVNVASTAHRMGKMRWDNLHGESFYERWLWYGQSKLANLLFTLELKQRLLASGSPVLSVACHPGYANTDLQLVGPRMSGSKVMMCLSRMSNALVAQSPEGGSWPTVMAATDSTVENGDYIGPSGLLELGGTPKKCGRSKRANNTDDARRLWKVSETLTGVRYLTSAE